MGIHILYPTGEDAKDIDLNLSLTLDIIAIHGLNGNPLTTWTDPKSQTLWFRDLLPSSIPNSRTLTFGYDATAAFERSTAGILEHARDLLRCLEELRKDREEMHRPLLFVAHSLGGLVLKQALVIAAKRGHRQYTPIWDATIGVLFFGTPHRGSSLATYGAQLARVPTALSMKPSPKLLTSLSIGCLELEDLNDVFKTLMDKEADRREVVSFYETRTMLGWIGLVVEQSSALINLAHSGKYSKWETPIPVNANHRTMCRFADVSDPTYITAVSSIRRLRRRGEAEEARNEFCVVPNNLNPHFTGRNSIRSVIRDSILVESCLVEGEKQRRFVLFGIGGSGKTQISLKFAQDFKSRFWAIFFIDASTLVNAARGFHAIAKTLKLPISTIPGATTTNVKELLVTKNNWLLIIDNADDPHLDVSQFFPSGDAGSILITTRNPEFVKYSNVGHSCVERMEEGDATTLLLRTSGLEPGIHLQEEESEEHSRIRESAKEVVHELGCLALAVIQAGAVIRQGMVSLGNFCSLYSKRSRELLNTGSLNARIEGQRSVHTTWEISIKMIEDIQESHATLALEFLQLFAFMHFDGIHAGMFEDALYHQGPNRGVYRSEFFSKSVLMTSMPFGWDAILAGKALGLLASFSLITMDEFGYISMHPLVHQWSKDRIGEQDRLQAWKLTGLTLAVASKHLCDATGYQQRKALLPHMDACLFQKEEELFSNGPELKDRIFVASTYARARREAYRTDTITISERSLTCLETMLPLEHFQILQAMCDFAADLALLNRHEEAIVIRKRWVEKQKEDSITRPDEIVASMTRLAESYLCFAQRQKAIDVCEAAIAEYIDKLGEGNIRIIEAREVVGSTKMELSQFSEARDCLEKCLERRRKYFKGDRAREAPEALGLLAFAYYALKQYKKAIVTQEQYVSRSKDILGESDVRTIVAISALERYRSARGSPVKNARRIAKGISSTKDVLQARHEHVQNTEVNAATLVCMDHLAQDYLACGALTKAHELQKDILQFTAERWGKDHEITIDCAKTLRRTERQMSIRKACYWWLPKGIRERDWLGIS